MDIPVYKLFLMKPNMEVLRLPEEKQQEMLAYSAQSMADVGGKSLLMAETFSDEDFTYFGVEWYPSLDAVIEYNRCLRKVNWFQYMDAEVFLGTHWNIGEEPDNMEPYHPVMGAPSPLYKVWIARFTKEGLAQVDLTPEEKEKSAAVRALDKELGIVQHLMVVTVQFKETWSAWGLERYPNHEALEKENQLKWEANWWKHSQTRTYLGTANGGLLSGLG